MRGERMPLAFSLFLYIYIYLVIYIMFVFKGHGEGELSQQARETVVFITSERSTISGYPSRPSQENQKRPGSKSHDLYERYKRSKTYGEVPLNVLKEESGRVQSISLFILKIHLGRLRHSPSFIHPSQGYPRA